MSTTIEHSQTTETGEARLGRLLGELAHYQAKSELLQQKIDLLMAREAVAIEATYEAVQLYDGHIDQLAEMGIRLEELPILAQGRSTVGLDVVLDACPRDLLVLLASCDGLRPALAQTTLRGLWRGSRELLDAYGICEFIYTDDEREVEKVNLTDRFSVLASLARQRVEDDTPVTDEYRDAMKDEAAEHLAALRQRFEHSPC